MRKLPLMVGALLAAACGSEHASSDRVLTAAKWPAAADTYDADTGVGCLPRSMLQICEVPEGSVIHLDGTITTPAGQVVSCDSACQFSDYTLKCYAGSDVGAEIPRPSESLACTGIPIPTPPNVLFYCCPGIP